MEAGRPLHKAVKNRSPDCCGDPRGLELPVLWDVCQGESCRGERSQPKREECVAVRLAGREETLRWLKSCFSTARARYLTACCHATAITLMGQPPGTVNPKLNVF